ncbi:MAG: alkaline phosphatase family protein, partial [Pseudomonadota bacterium]
MFPLQARWRALFAVSALLVALLWAGPAQAYIGPGAGFAFAGSFMVLIATFFLAIGTIAAWPFLWLWRRVRVGNPFKRATVRRVVVLGLDGMDPGIATRLMQEGRLPNFAALAEKGCFRPLATTYPSMSPVAWSTFSTGVDPSRHAIYDFLDRNPKNYLPRLSSTDIGNPSRILSLGPWRVPLGKPRLALLQRSQTFWKLLGEKHIFSIIQRVPITWPARAFNGLLLSAMCVPDLRGSQGTFSFFSTAQKDGGAAFTGGEQTVLRRDPKAPRRFRSRIVGPDNSMRADGGRMILPFTIVVAEDEQSARIEIDGAEPFTLQPGVYSPWIDLVFKPGLGIAVHGIARFYFTSLSPEVNLYMTAIHIDPEHPAMPIAHPSTYSIYLARKQGKFATLGLAEDTWALNERVLDEKAFLEQCYLNHDEREKMFFHA